MKFFESFSLILLLFKFCYSSTTNQSFDILFTTKTTYTEANEFVQKNSQNELPFSIPSYCKPKMFNLITRHGIRHPNKKNIILMKSKINFIRDSIIKNKKVNPLLIEKFKNWELKVELKDASRISDTGFEETRKFAKKFKNDYSEFFENTNISFFGTQKNRTYETALGFFEGIGLKKDFVFDVKQSLDFHETCKIKLNEKGIYLKDSKQIKELKKSVAFAELRKKIATIVGVDFENFTFKDLSLIYTTCVTDIVLYKEDTWCQLFNNQDFILFEYLNDLKTYSKTGYGLKMNSKMACPILADLFSNMDAIKNNKQTKTLLQFSHSPAFKRIYAILGLFENFGSSLCRGSNYCNNEWRLSLILPFLANINFIVYDCSTNELENDYKIVTKVQDQPVKVYGCDDLLCSYDQFVKKYKKLADNCNLDKICSL